MIVSCSSCATKFHIPDNKVAGKRARMKCKKCKAPIEIDGSSISIRASDLEATSGAASRTGTEPSRPKNEPLSPAPSGLSPRWRVAEPSGHRHEMSLDSLATQYASGGFEPGTLVCQPGDDKWMPPYDYPDIMAKASPLEESAPSAASFTDVTVALSRAESAALTRQAQPSYPALSGGSAKDSFESFFDGDDVEGAMRSFDNIKSAAPPSYSSAPPSSGVARSTAPPPPRRPRPQTIPSVPAPAAPGSWAPRPVLAQGHSSMAPPPSSGTLVHGRSSAPPAAMAPPALVAPVRRPSVPPGVSPGSRTSHSSVARPPPTRRSTPPPLPASSPAAALRPSSPPSAPAAASLRPTASATLRPSAPPASTAGVTSAAAVQSYPAAAYPAAPQYAAYGEVSSTRVYDTRPHAAGLHAVPSSARPSSPPLRTISGAPLSLPGNQDSGLSGLSGLSGITPRSTGPSGTFILFLTLVLIAGAVVGIYVFRPSLFDRGVEAIHSLLGRRPPASVAINPSGPPFDEAAAGVVLNKAANETSVCKTGDGPVGKGRVRVLYQPDGRAQKVAVSEPFHDTQVGRCLVEHFKNTHVPPFGGEPVIVNKTFELE